MPTYTVQSSALQLSTLYSKPYQIRNSGDATIYLGKDTTVSSGQYDWSLSPGDTLGFGAETFLYVICAPGESSTLEQQYGALGNFTPGPSNVLARLSNDLTLLATETLVITSAVSNSLVDFYDIDVSQYASILVSIRGTMDPVGGLGSPSELNRLEGTLEFYNDPLEVINSNSITAYNPQWLMLDKHVAGTNRYVSQTIQVPVSARLFLLRILAIKQLTAALVSGEIVVSIYGSNEQITSPRYVAQGLGVDNSLTATEVFTVERTAGGTTTVFIASDNGLKTFTLMMLSGSTTGTQFTCYALKSGVARPINQLGIATTSFPTTVQNQINLPLLPLRVVLFTAGVATIDGVIA